MSMRKYCRDGGRWNSNVKSTLAPDPATNGAKDQTMSPSVEKRWASCLGEMIVVMNDVVRQPCLILTLLITRFDVNQHTPAWHQDENDISNSTYNIINANPQTVHSNSSLSKAVA